MVGENSIARCLSIYMCSPYIGSAEYTEPNGIGGLGDSCWIGCLVISAQKAKQARHVVLLCVLLLNELFVAGGA